MKYVFLIHRDEKQWDDMSARERDTFANACLVHEQSLQQSGRLFAVEGPRNSHTAVLANGVDGQVSLTDTDHPFAETKGQLIQLFFINARDLNEAIQVALKMPQVRKGIIEVRLLMELSEK